MPHPWLLLHVIVSGKYIFCLNIKKKHMFLKDINIIMIISVYFRINNTTTKVLNNQTEFNQFHIRATSVTGTGLSRKDDPFTYSCC
jgi:hypothetical protein